MKSLTTMLAEFRMRSPSGSKRRRLLSPMFNLDYEKIPKPKIPKFKNPFQKKPLV
jgi:hypothetical protein